MSTVVEIHEFTPFDEEPLRKPVGEIELTPSDQEHLRIPVVAPPHSKPKHTIFLSHSGAQKDFVEQLYEDLVRSHHSPFFDKDPDSLPKGVDFAQRILIAAQQCELAIVVVSEDYFIRSKWPMVELAALVHSSKRKILPLFFGLSCEEFEDPERRKRWFQKWEAWAAGDSRVQVEEWKLALREVNRRNGLVYVKELGEVGFRRQIVATVGDILPKDEVPVPLPPFSVKGPWHRALGPLIILKVVGIIISVVLFFVLLFAVILPKWTNFPKEK